MVGYLGGRWDTNTQRRYQLGRGHLMALGSSSLVVAGGCCPLALPWKPSGAELLRLLAVLTVLRAFPCRTRLGDTDSAAAVEEEVTAGCGGCAVLCPLQLGDAVALGLDSNPSTVPH